MVPRPFLSPFLWHAPPPPPPLPSSLSLSGTVWNLIVFSFPLENHLVVLRQRQIFICIIDLNWRGNKNRGVGLMSTLLGWPPLSTFILSLPIVPFSLFWNRVFFPSSDWEIVSSSYLSHWLLPLFIGLLFQMFNPLERRKKTDQNYNGWNVNVQFWVTSDYQRRQQSFASHFFSMSLFWVGVGGKPEALNSLFNIFLKIWRRTEMTSLFIQSDCSFWS